LTVKATDKNVLEFLEDLKNISNKHGIELCSCACCGGIWLSDATGVEFTGCRVRESGEYLDGLEYLAQREIPW
jgi:hypothetical protein